MLVTTAAYSKRLQSKLNDNLKWAGIKLKPSRSRSISVVKGKSCNTFSALDEDLIPAAFEKHVKNLG